MLLAFFWYSRNKRHDDSCYVLLMPVWRPLFERKTFYRLETIYGSAQSKSH